MKMMDMLKAKMKDKKPVSGMEKDAKISVLGNLKDLLQKSMGSKLSDMKKVSVVADSKEGLEEGLDEAKEVVEEVPEEGMEDDMGIEEKKPEVPAEPETAEEIEQKIQELLKKKQMIEEG